MTYIDNNEVLEYFHHNTLNGWFVEECNMSGAISYYNSHHDTVVYATPNWDTDGVVPIASCDGEDYKEITEIVLSGSISEQLTEYTTIIESILSKIKK